MFHRYRAFININSIPNVPQSGNGNGKQLNSVTVEGMQQKGSCGHTHGPG